MALEKVRFYLVADALPRATSSGGRERESAEVRMPSPTRIKPDEPLRRFFSGHFVS